MRKKLAAAAIAAVLPLSLATAGQASAGDVGDSTIFDEGSGSWYHTHGSFTWFNRTVTVAGYVATGNPAFDNDPKPVTVTRVYFEAYNLATKVEIQSRSTDYEASPKSFRFDLSTDRVGGIDRIRITRCGYFGEERLWCDTPKNYSRPF
ncbi:hypothetical protein [Actinocrispum sp. NPDC049592]|uniref:hypothetical protein n=1 Tax=Actinocrispum sp. NPDC049592 TaxID=3154835 RepID=UPI003412FE69